jgi:glutamate-1-semialdehyde 2,1-aminomutase
VNRPGLLGQVADLSLVAKAVEFNDIAAVEAALKTGEIAAILTEPVMTNSCMVLPDPGFHKALRQLARQHGAAGALQGQRRRDGWGGIASHVVSEAPSAPRG